VGKAGNRPTKETQQIETPVNAKSGNATFVIALEAGFLDPS
jgi:hypothetical protein